MWLFHFCLTFYSTGWKYKEALQTKEETSVVSLWEDYFITTYFTACNPSNERQQFVICAVNRLVKSSQSNDLHYIDKWGLLTW